MGPHGRCRSLAIVDLPCVRSLWPFFPSFFFFSFFLFSILFFIYFLFFFSLLGRRTSVPVAIAHGVPLPGPIHSFLHHPVSISTLFQGSTSASFLHSHTHTHTLFPHCPLIHSLFSPPWSLKPRRPERWRLSPAWILIHTHFIPSVLPLLLTTLVCTWGTFPLVLSLYWILCSGPSSSSYMGHHPPDYGVHIS